MNQIRVVVHRVSVLKAVTMNLLVFLEIVFQKILMKMEIH
jgi:hypothetical protein